MNFKNLLIVVGGALVIYYVLLPNAGIWTYVACFVWGTLCGVAGYSVFDKDKER